MRRVVRAIRTAPATSGYVLALAATTLVLQTSSPRMAKRLLLAHSTNLRHLATDPIRVLIGSAFWLTASWQLVAWAVLFAVVLAPVERRIGSGRTTLVFAAGHIGATLLTALGLWIALQLDAVEHSVVNAPDVGASYGFFAVAALMTVLLDRRLRVVYASGIALFVLGSLALTHTFTDVGHLLSVLLGVACLPLARRARGVATPIGEQLLRLTPRPEAV